MLNMNEIAFKAAKETVEASKDSLKNEIIPETVKQTMTNLGVDVSSPQESQADFLYLRKKRKNSEKYQEYKMRALISGVVGVVIAAIVAYFKG